MLNNNILYFSLAVLYTFYTSVTRTIPTTSYMKAVDWWLLYHIAGPFIIFNVIILNEHKSRKDHYMKQEKEKKMIWIAFETFVDCFVFFGKFVLPAVTAVFVLIFTITVSLHY